MVFSVPSFNTVGDDYDKKGGQTALPKGGKSFAVPGPKKGNGTDATFSKVIASIHEGDKYVDPGTAEKRYKREQAKKRITPQGFRMASLPQKACGLGGYFGCLGQPTPHETDFIVPRKGEAPPKKTQEKRNIFTAPTKMKDNLSTYGGEYIADFYDQDKEKQKAAREAHQKKLKGAAFKGASRLGGTFDENMGTGASKCYQMTKPMTILKNKKDLPPLKGPENPWRPGGPTEKLMPQVEYREDPYDGFDPRVGTVKKKTSSGRAGWKPGGATNSSWYTKSIAFGRL